MADTVSAIPQDLLKYSAAGQRLAKELEKVGRDLEATLERFRTSRPDPQLLRSVPALGDRMTVHATTHGTVSEWVGRVGRAFAAAGGDATMLVQVDATQLRTILSQAPQVTRTPPSPPAKPAQPGLWQNVTGFFGGAWNSVSGWFSNAWNTVSGWIAQAWNAITGWLSNLWQSLMDLLGAIGRFLDGIRQWLVDHLGPFWGGLVWGFISTLAVILVGAGIIALIALVSGPAAIVAAVVLLVAAVGFAIYNRFSDYFAEHGHGPDFWTGVALVLLGVADLTGIPSIVEGIVGWRAFGTHPLTPEERGLLIGSGLAALLTIFFVFARKMFFRTDAPAADPFDALRTKYGLTDDQLNAIRATGVDPALVDRLFARGLSADDIAAIARDQGRAGLELLDSLTGQGVQRGPALRAVRDAASMGMLDDVLRLVQSGHLRNPATLPRLLRAATTDAGIRRQIQFAIGLADQGHDVAIENGQADVVDYGTTPPTAYQLKVLTTRDPRNVVNYIDDAARQLRGEGGENPPAGATTVDRVELNNPANPLYDLNDADLLAQLIAEGVTRSMLRGVTELIIVNGTGTHTYYPSQFPP